MKGDMTPIEMKFEHDTTAHNRRLMEVVAGEAQFSDLNSDERSVTHALIDTNIAFTAVSQRFGPSGRRSGQRTVSLDDDGNLIEITADGTTRRL